MRLPFCKPELPVAPVLISSMISKHLLNILLPRINLALSAFGLCKSQ